MAVSKLDKIIKNISKYKNWTYKDTVLRTFGNGPKGRLGYGAPREHPRVNKTTTKRRFTKPLGDIELYITSQYRVTDKINKKIGSLRTRNYSKYYLELKRNDRYKPNIAKKWGKTN